MKSQAIFEIPQVLMGSSLGSRWNTFASMQKKKYLQLVAKCLRQCTFTSYFPLPCYQNCKDSTSKRRLVYLPFCGTQQMFIRRGCAPRSNPLPFYMQFFTKKVPVSYTFYWQMVPLSHTLYRTLHPF